MNQEESKKEMSEQTNYVDPRTVNASVIGELRKDKIGKPILVFEIFGLLLVVLIGLPIVNTMLENENSALYKLLNGPSATVIDPENPSVSEYLDGSKEQPLVSSSKIKVDNIIMQNFILSGNKIIVTINSYNDIINLDLKSYYLEVYSNSSHKLAAVKITGTYDNQEKEVELSANGLNFNESYSYFGKIVLMGEDDYPAVTISSDESGVGSFLCKKDNRTLEYVFKNNYLISIKDNFKYSFSNEQTDVYLATKKEYDKKRELLGTMANIEEVSDGFIFSANIDLETPGFKYPSDLIDYEYYELDTEAKIIHYALQGKGFDCK